MNELAAKLQAKLGLLVKVDGTELVAYTTTGVDVLRFSTWSKRDGKPGERALGGVGVALRTCNLSWEMNHPEDFETIILEPANG